MARSIFLLALLLLPLAGQAAPDYWDAELGVSLATRLQGQERFFQRSMQLLATIEDSGGEVYYKAKGRVRYDNRYDGSHPYSEEAESAYRHDADWRHLYLGMPLADGELTFGLQQVVWGRADELRVLDQVNPVDYRHGVTALLDDSRIAVPMLRYTRSVDDWEWEGLFITAFEQNQPPAPGSEFDSPAFAVPDPAYFHVVSDEDYKGRRGFSYGMSANGRIGTVDVSLVALSSRPFDPVYAVQGQEADGRLRVQPQFPRYTMLGAGLATDTGSSVVLRSEIAYFDNWQVTNPTVMHGSEQSTLLKSLLGIDYLYREWMISAQWQGQRVVGWREGMLVPRSEDLFTLSVEGSHAQDRLKSRFLAAFYPPARDNTWMQGLFNYKPADWLRLGLEINLFFGAQDRIFGAYDKNDHIRFSTAYVF
ncbi:MAG: DUF1302 family protein [Pseudomonadota bacterium]